MQVWKPWSLMIAEGCPKKDGDANGVLAMTQEGAGFSCKDKMEVYQLIT